MFMIDPNQPVYRHRRTLNSVRPFDKGLDFAANSFFFQLDCKTIMTWVYDS